MAKKLSKSVKITIISIAVALCVACATILGVVLFNKSPKNLTASQQAFFAALNSGNKYSSDLASEEIDLGTATYDYLVSAYDGYALVKVAGSHDILSTKEGYEGKSIELNFSKVLTIFNDFVIIKDGDKYQVCEVTYPTSSTVQTTIKYSNIDSIKFGKNYFATLTGDTLKVHSNETAEVVFSKENVIDFSISNDLVSFTYIEFDGDDVYSIANLYSFKSGEKLIYEAINEASVSATQTKYFIDGKYINLDNITLVRVAGDYVLMQSFTAALSEDADVVISGKYFKLSQSVKNLVSGKVKNLPSNMFFDSVFSDLTSYLTIVGDKIQANKQINYNDRYAYYYDKNFELLISYDYDALGKVIDYKHGLAVCEKGFVDVLGNGDKIVNEKLAQKNINALMLSSDRDIVFAKSATEIYKLNIATGKIESVASSTSSLVDGFMFVEVKDGLSSTYYLMNNKGEKNEIEGVATDANLIAYSKLSTGYYFKIVDANTVSLVSYKGDVLANNIPKDAIFYSITNDKTQVVLAIKNVDGAKIFRSRLPKGALLPNLTDDVIVYGLINSRPVEMVSAVETKSYDVPEQTMGSDFNADNSLDPFFIKTSGTNIEIATYYQNVLVEISFEQYNTILNIITDVETEVVKTDSVVTSQAFNSLVNYYEIVKEERDYYAANVKTIERSRNINFEVETNGSSTVQTKQLWYNQVYGSALALDIPVSEREGYIFDGYFYTYESTEYRVTTGATLDIDLAVKEKIMPTRSAGEDINADITVTPKFTPINYTVKFNANTTFSSKLDVQGNISNINATYDISYELPASVFTSIGFKQIGWSLSDDNVVAYLLTSQIKNLANENNAIVTLYAVWAYNTYEIMYNANNGNFASDALAFNTNGSAYATQKQTVTIESSSITYPDIILISQTKGTAASVNYFADDAATKNFLFNSVFFDYVENGNPYFTSEKLTSSATEGNKYVVQAYAAYEPMTAQFTYDARYETKNLNGNSVSASVYKAFQLGTYSTLNPITEFVCGDQSITGSRSAVSGTISNIADGSSFETSINISLLSAYIKRIEINIYVGSTLHSMVINGVYNKNTQTVSYNVSGVDTSLVEVVSSNENSIALRILNVHPSFDFNTNKSTVGGIKYVLGLREFNIGATLDGATVNVDYPNMTSPSYTYKAAIFFGRNYSITMQTKDHYVFKNLTINSNTYTFAREYDGYNNLYIDGETSSLSQNGVTYTRDYVFGEVNVQLSFDGTKYTLKIYGQATRNLSVAATTEAVKSTLTVSATNKSGSSDGISYVKRVDNNSNMLGSNEISPVSSYNIKFATKTGYRLTQINLVYDSKNIGTFVSFDYNNYDPHTGKYNSIDSVSGTYVDSEMLIATGVKVDYNSSGYYYIAIANVSFDLDVEIVYERVSEFVVNIQDVTKVNILDQEGENILEKTNVQSVYSDGKLRVRILGNEDITEIHVKAVGEVVYYIDSATSATGMSAVQFIDKQEVKWDSYTASSVEVTMIQYGVTVSVTTYLGKGNNQYDLEHLRDGGTYYTNDSISFAYKVDSVLKTPAIGSLLPSASKSTISFNGNRLQMFMADTTGASKGYLAYRYVLKDKNDVVVADVTRSGDSISNLDYTLSVEDIENLNNQYTLDIYYKAIEYTVVYNKGTFDIVADQGNTTNGEISSEVRVFNVYKNVTSERYTRLGWKHVGWTTDDSAVTVSGKAAMLFDAVNLSNENGYVYNVYAAWETDKYDIEYIFNDKAYGNGSSVATDTTEGLQDIYYLANFNNLKTLVRDGYKFKGWFVSANIDGAQVTNQQLSYANFVKLQTSGDLDDTRKIITLTAQWDKITYNLTAANFFFNDADENGTSTATVVAGSTNVNITFDTTIPTLPTLERIGYNFMGWATSLDDGKMMVTPGNSLNATLYAKLTGANKTAETNPNFNLYAIWEKQPFTVRFDMNNNVPGNSLSDSGFSATPNSIQVYFDSEFGALPTVSANGYVFKGWHANPNYDYLNEAGNNLEEFKYTADMLLSMANWNDLFVTKTQKLEDDYVNGTTSTYVFTLYAYWEIETRTVSIYSFTGVGKVNTAPFGDTDLSEQTNVSQTSAQMKYGDYAIVELVPTTGRYVSAITISNSVTTITYNISWNSAEHKISLDNADLSYSKDGFVEDVGFTLAAYDYSSDVNKITILLTFVKSDIKVSASQKDQTYEVLFKDNLNNANSNLFVFTIKYDKKIADYLFVYPYRVGYKFEKYVLSNTNGDSAEDSKFIDEKIYYDTVITLVYNVSSVQKVNFYLWNGAEYVLESVSNGYVLNEPGNANSGTSNGVNYSLSTDLVPITGTGGTQITIGGTSQMVVGFVYGGILTSLPAENTTVWPQDTYLVGYIQTNTAPASYYTRNMPAGVSIGSTKLYSAGDMIEEEINLYAVYDKPAFEFNNAGSIDNITGFSVAGYSLDDVLFVGLSEEGILRLKEIFLENKNLPAALQEVMSDAVCLGSEYNVAYLTAEKNGQTYIYRVADNYYDYSAATAVNLV